MAKNLLLDVCILFLLLTQLQRKRWVLWVQRATKRSTIFNLVKITLQNVANIKLSNFPFYYFYHFLLSSNCSKYLLSKFLPYVNISTSYTDSILQMFSKGYPNFSTVLQWCRTFPKNLQGALCVFKFKVWKFHSSLKVSVENNSLFTFSK